MTYEAKKPYSGFFENRFGYRIRADQDTWTVCGKDGAVRTHDGFAVFDTEQQANWAIELMGHAAYEAKEELQKDLRSLLGVADLQGEEE